MALALLLLGEPGSEVTFISSIEVHAAEDLDWSRPLEAEVQVADPAMVYEVLYGNPRPDSAEGPLRVTLSSPFNFEEPPDEAMKRPSFVVDYNELSVQDLLRTLRTLHGGQPSIEQLVSFSFDAISKKISTRGWDVASVVARDGAGDCTEHAVLLTALARASGYAARVGIGVVILRFEDTTAGFGHAWSEIHDGSRWQIADATKIDEQATALYVRSAPLKNEGPGYRMALFNSLVQRIEISNTPISGPATKRPTQ